MFAISRYKWKVRSMDLRMKRSVPTWRQTKIVAAALALWLFYLTAGEFRKSIRRSQEAVYKQDVFTIQQAVHQYTLDKQHPPNSLQDLVKEHYLGGIPNAPLTPEMDGAPVLADPVLSPNLSVFRLTDVNSSSGKATGNATTHNTR
jgi:hypothetical protein